MSLPLNLGPPATTAGIIPLDQMDWFYFMQHVQHEAMNAPGTLSTQQNCSWQKLNLGPPALETSITSLDQIDWLHA
jgi:hypothetical protein